MGMRSWYSHASLLQTTFQVVLKKGEERGGRVPSDFKAFFGVLYQMQWVKGGFNLTWVCIMCIFNEWQCMRL